MDARVDSQTAPRTSVLLAPGDQRTVAVLLALWLVVAAGRMSWLAAGPGLARFDEPQPAPHLLVNVNHAAETELSLLPRIGPTLASRIIERRQQQGPFLAPEDLLQVRGIGPKTLHKMRPHVDCGLESKGDCSLDLQGAGGAF